MAAATVASPPAVATERSVLLPRVSWESYERLLADDQERRAPRLTFDRGVLEIVSPSAEHERRTRVLEVLVNAVAEELGVDIVGFGSTKGGGGIWNAASNPTRASTSSTSGRSARRSRST